MSWDDEIRVDQHLDFYRGKLRQTEERLEDLALEVALSEAARGLAEHPVWKRLSERVEDAIASETERLQTMDMNAQELGRRQGKIQALRMIRLAKPMEPERLAQIEEEITLQRNERQKYQDLLS